MAKSKDNILENVLKLKEKQGIKRPAGDNSAEEIQYKNTDLILGIAAVSMFGKKFKSTKHTNINTVLGQTSFLEDIDQKISVLQKSSNKFKDKILSLIEETPNGNMLKVSLESTDVRLLDISEGVIKKLLEKKNNKIGKKDDNTTKILLSIDKAHNLTELIESLENLKNVTINSDKVIENIQFFVDIVKAINTLPEIKSIKIDLNIIDNIKKFINEIANINDKQNVIDNITYLSDTIQSINNLQEIKSISFDLDNINGIKDYIKVINDTIKDSQSIEENVQIFVDILKTINNLQEIKPISFDLDNINGIKDYIKTINKIVVNPEQIGDNVRFLKDIINVINKLPEVKSINLDTKIINNIKKFIEGVNTLNLDNLKKIDDKSLEGIKIIINSINNLPEIKSIDIDAIDNIKCFIEGTNELNFDNLKSIDDQSIERLTTIINSINNLPELKSINVDKNVIDNIKDFIKGTNDLNFDNLKAIDEKSLEGLKTLFDFINNFPDKTKIENINFNKIFDTIAKIDTQKLNTNELKKKIGELIKIIEGVENSKEYSFSTLFESIKNIFKGKDEIISDITGISNVLNFITDVISYDKDINLKTLNILLDVTQKNGKIEQLFNQVKEIAKEDINFDSIEAISKYFDAIASLGEIGLLKRLRIRSNLRFFENYVNKTLPDFVKDINKRFDKITEVKNIPGLYNLKSLFEMISQIGEISIKKKMKLKLNLLYIKHFIIDDIVDFLKKLNTTIEEGTKDIKVAEINKLLTDILNITQIEDEKLEDSQYVIETLHKIVYKSKYSIASLLEAINNNKQTFIDANQNIQNIQHDVDLIASFAKDANLNEDEILNIIEPLSLIRHKELPLISKIINYLQNNIEPNENIKDKLKIIQESYFDSINDINKNLLKLINIENIESIIVDIEKELTNMSVLMQKTDELVDAYNKVDNKIFDNINDFLKTLKIDSKSVSSLKAISTLSKNVENLVTFMTKINEIKIPNKQFITKLTDFIVKLDEALSNKKTLDSIVKKLVVSKKTISDFDNTKKVLHEISEFNDTIKKVVTIGKLLGPFQKILEKEASIVNNFVKGFSKIDPKKIKAAKVIIKELTRLIMMSSLVLIIGALAMSFIKVENLLIFTATLAIFVGIMAKICIMISNQFGKKNLKNFSTSIKGLIKIVTMSATALLIGGLLMNFIKPENLVLFGVSLLIFTTALWIPLKLFTSLKEKMMQGAIDFGKLVFMCGLTLAIGSLITQLVPFSALFSFAVNLGLFITLLSVPLFFIALGGGKILLHGAGELGKLVLMSTLALTIGGLFMMIPGLWAKSLLFGAILGAFIMLLSVAIGLGAKLSGGRGMKVAKDIRKLVIMSAGILLIGGLLFMLMPNLPKNVLYFGVILAGFIGLISLSIGLAGKIARKGIKHMWQISLLVAISGAVLITAGLLMKEDPNMMKNIFGFTLAVLLLVGGFVLIAKLADIKKLWRGLLSIGIITLIILGITYAFSQMKELLAYNIGQLWALTASMLGIIAMFLLGAGVIGLIASVTWPFLLIGAAVMMLAGLLVWGIGWTLSKVLEIDKEYNLYENKDKLNTIVDVLFDSVEHILTRIYNLKTSDSGLTSLIKKIPLVGGVIGTAVDSLTLFPNLAVAAAGILATMVIAHNLSKLIFYMKLCGENPIAEIDKAGDLIEATLRIFSRDDVEKQLQKFDANRKLIIALVEVTDLLGESMGSIAEGIKDWAKLKIPVYDGTKIDHYISLKDEDFVKSAQNIQKVVVCLGQAIIDIYENTPNKFMFQPIGLFGNSIFSNVCRSMRNIGKMLESMASGIKDWSNLKIPIYKEGSTEIKGYLSIDNKEFVKAAENIKSVVTCLAGAVLDVYYGNEDMFKSGWFTDSPFTNVCEGIELLGDALGSMANGIKDWAELKIPVYKGANVDHYISLTDKDFVKAGENIKKVVTCLSGAVLEVYNGNEDMFKSGWFTDSPFTNVCEGLELLGKALSGVANGVKDWADLKIPVYKGTAIDHYLSLKDKDFVKAGENIKTVVKCLAQAVIDIYNEDPTMFKSGWFTDSPFTNVCEGMELLGRALGGIAGAVKDWADLKIPVYKGTEVDHYISLKDDDFIKVGENIQRVVTCLLTSIADLYEGNEELYDGSGIFGLGSSPIAKVLGVIPPLGNTLKDIAQAVQAWADLKIPVYGTDNEGKAVITSYITMGNDTFTKVTKNIDKVVTSLISSVANLYTKHEDWFDGTGIFGLGDSPIGKVLGSIVPLGKTLKDIADAVQAWADLKIPIYGTDKDGRAIITDYKTLGETDFKNATDHINQVVTFLVEAIGNLYDKHQNDGWFDGSWFLGKSKISKVLTSIEPLGNIVSGIADGIVSFAEFKIPTYGTGPNGEAIITGYTTLNDNAIEQAAENIGKVVTALVKSVAKLYDLQEAKAGHWFDKDMWFMPGNTSPIGKVLTSIEPLGNTIGVIAEGIKGFADFKIPIYEKDKIVGYKTFASSDFDTAANNIGLIITTLGNAISSVVKDNPGIFDNANNPTVKAAEAIKLTADTLNGIASVIYYYASGEFPVLKYDKNGKLIPGAVKKIGNNEIASMKTRVNTIITALGEAIVQVYDKPDNKRIWDSFDGMGFKKDAPASIVANSIKLLAESLNNTIDVITKIIELDFNKIAAKMNEKDGLVMSFKNVMNAIADIYGIISVTAAPTIAGPGLVKYNVNMPKGLAAWMDENSTNLHTIVSAISRVQENVDKVFNYVDSLVTSYKDNEKNIEYFTKRNGENFVIVEKIDQILQEIRSLILSCTSVDLTKTIDLQSLYKDTLFLTMIINKIANITKDITGLDGSAYHVIADGITALTNALNEFQIQDKTQFEYIDYFIDDIEAFIQKVDIIIDAAEFKEKVNVLKEGIKGLADVIAGIKSNKNFSDHTKTLKNYVENTNKLNLKKIHSLTNLVNAINEFGTKFGNIDDFTNAIVEKLTESLTYLGGKLDKAKETIETVENLHGKRKRLIEDSVKNIKDLMEKELIVNIKEEQPDIFGSIGGGSEGGEGNEGGEGGSNIGSNGLGQGGTPPSEPNIQKDQPVTRQQNQPQHQTRNVQINNTGGLNSAAIGKAIASAIDSKAIGDAIAKAVSDYLNGNGKTTH